MIRRSVPRISIVTTSYVRHEQYNSATLVNDVAVYFLPVDVPFNGKSLFFLNDFKVNLMNFL